MSDDLAAYHEEIREIEDAWFQEQTRIENASERASGSMWTRDWGPLREIWERHGIGPDDPRVFSIASYRHENKIIQDRWDSDCREQVRLYRANPEVDTPYGWSTREYHNHELNCMARHFPGLDYRNPEVTANTIPKAWAFIWESLRIADLHKQTTLGREILDGVSLKRAEETYTILLRIQVPWAPDPTHDRLSFTGKHYRDHLQSIANRLEREEAESLPSELRRTFAAGSLECARLERIMAGPAEISPSTRKRNSAQPHSKTEPPREAFAAYKLSIELGRTQKEIADILQKQLRKPVLQSQVSRWINRVRQWNGSADRNSKPKTITVDPARLDLGPRRHPRQEES